MSEYVAGKRVAHMIREVDHGTAEALCGALGRQRVLTMRRLDLKELPTCRRCERSARRRARLRTAVGFITGRDFGDEDRTAA